MKPTLFSLSLVTLLATGTLAGNAGSEKLCVKNPDTNICSLTVVSDHLNDGAGGKVFYNYVHVFDNECFSIIDSDDCDGALCSKDIANEETPITVGVKGKEYTVEIDSREQGDIHKHPPLFSYKYAADGSDDYEDTDGPCTCAHDTQGGGPLDRQSCSCWFKCKP